MKKIVLALMLITQSAQADFYLDLGIGMHTSKWHDQPSRDKTECIVTTGISAGCKVNTTQYNNYLSKENPLGRVRVGYEYKINRIVSANIYGEHTSSVPTDKERGLNVIMLEGRINLSELFR